jgi:peptidyl-tRNA hydrolase, PTH1 family
VKLIIGLGNPGMKYQFTRHNIGFRILDAFVTNNVGEDKKWKNNFFSQFLQYQFKGQKIFFAKPQTYMNLSGRAVKEIVNYYGISEENILVICDDIHLSLGNLRIRKRGSSGGHRGIESIIQSLGTEEFPRLRIGIKNESLLQKMDYPSFVLSNFLSEEEQYLSELITKAVKALEDLLSFGFEFAMREYNRSESEIDNSNASER